MAPLALFDASRTTGLDGGDVARGFSILDLLWQWDGMLPDGPVGRGLWMLLIPSGSRSLVP